VAVQLDADACTVHGVLEDASMHRSPSRPRFGSTLVLLTVSLTGAVYGCTITAMPAPSQSEDPTAPTTPSPTAPTTTATAVPDAGPIVTPPVVAPPPVVADAGGSVIPSTGNPIFPAPPPQCNAGSLHEVEPNDTPATANVLGPPWVICGTVAPGEVDYISFATPAPPVVLDSVSYAASWTGNGTPSITLSAGGITVPAGAKPPLVPGATYTFEVVGGAAPLSYVITVNVTAAQVL
jgi:hypothetical protein